MYFKIEKGTEVFNKLDVLHGRIQEVNKTAKELVKKLGGNRYCGDQNRLAGGIDAIEFEQKPEGYRSVGGKWDNLYLPNARNKVNNQLIAELPTLQYDELNSIVGFKGPQTAPHPKGLSFVSIPSICFSDEVMLMKVPDGCKYTAPEGVTEIIYSEYQGLKNAWDEKNKK
ncbi:MAG TPA: hypothetical protein DCL77_14440 [Prolixibacteraceae bacterium]|jgi:hypothetical protein|nr:hypothetical protein [Prolixibacteraceae bacterium]